LVKGMKTHTKKDSSLHKVRQGKSEKAIILIITKRNQNKKGRKKG